VADSAGAILRRVHWLVPAQRADKLILGSIRFGARWLVAFVEVALSAVGCPPQRQPAERIVDLCGQPSPMRLRASR